MALPTPELKFSSRLKPQNESLYVLAFLLGASFLVFYAALTLFGSLSFIAGWKLTPVSTLLAAISGLVFFFIAGFKVSQLSAKVLLSGLGVAILAWTIALMVASWMYDLSADGRDYQQLAIYQLRQGWNPVSTEQEPVGVYYNEWLNHYPKAPWIAAASIYQLSGNIESGKAINLMLIMVCFFIVFSLLQTYTLHPLLTIAIALLAALNPVSMSQSLSYYVDGQVASLYTIVMALLLLAQRRPGRIVMITIVAALIVGLNIKFTATIYLLFVVGGMFTWFVIRKRWTHPWQMLGVLATGALAGALLAGYQPYVTNTLHYGNPFYPVYGSQEFNQDYIIGKQRPANFVGKNRFETLFLSTFSRTQNTFGQDSGPLKFPLSVSRQELQALRAADLRVGGFGPWFGASVLVAAAVLVWLVIFEGAKALDVILAMALVVGTALVNPETWWARYSPQWWLVIILVMVAGLLSQVKPIRWLTFVLLFLITINMGMVAGSYLVQNAHDTWRTNQTLSALAKSGEAVLVYYQPYDLMYLKLDKWGINYKEATSLEELPCPHEFMRGIYYSPLNCSP